MSKMFAVRRFLLSSKHELFNHSGKSFTLRSNNVFPLNESAEIYSNFRYLTTSCPSFQKKARERKPKKIDPARVRDKIISPEVSIRYMNSTAYATTYGDEPVWVKYRRNHKGQFAPKLTRVACIIDGYVYSGNPCPICRDEYLVVHYTNVKLLKQFISPYTGEILSAYKTNVCREKYFAIEVELAKAKYYGLITFDLPFRQYNYAEFYPQLKNVACD